MYVMFRRADLLLLEELMMYGRFGGLDKVLSIEPVLYNLPLEKVE